jgi:DNA-binding transcriptional regulator GbsR (MarR family)
LLFCRITNVYTKLTTKLKNNPDYNKLEKINPESRRRSTLVKLNKIDELVVKTLKTERKELSLQELAEKTGESSKKVFKSLRKLFENEIIDTKERKYRLLNP